MNTYVPHEEAILCPAWEYRERPKIKKQMENIVEATVKVSMRHIATEIGEKTLETHYREET